MSNKRFDEKKLEKWDLPLGFSRALVQDEETVKVFVSMPKPEREKYIERAKEATSKTEMQRIVGDIASTNFVDFI